MSIKTVSWAKQRFDPASDVSRTWPHRSYAPAVSSSLSSSSEHRWPAYTTREPLYMIHKQKPMAVGPAHECTLTHTGMTLQWQWLARCMTCAVPSSSSSNSTATASPTPLWCCLQCLQHCHFGHHVLAIEWVRGFCVCGVTKRCRPCNPFLSASCAYRTIESAKTPLTLPASAAAPTAPGAVAVPGADWKEPAAVVSTMAESQPPLPPVRFRHPLWSQLVNYPPEWPQRWMQTCTYLLHVGVPGLSRLHSPLQFSTLLSIMAIASLHETERACMELLGCTKKAALFRTVQTLVHTLNSVPGIVYRHWMYADPAFDINKRFSKFFEPYVTVSDWTGNLAEVNELVRVESRGRVPQLIPDADVKSPLGFFMASILCVRITWEKQFHPGATRVHRFSSTFERPAPTGDVLQTHTYVRDGLLMYRGKNKYRYYVNTHYQYVELYVNDAKKEWVMGFAQPLRRQPTQQLTFVVPAPSEFKETTLSSIWIPKFHRKSRLYMRHLLEMWGLGPGLSTTHGTSPLQYEISGHPIRLQDMVCICDIQVDETGFEPPHEKYDSPHQSVADLRKMEHDRTAPLPVAAPPIRKPGSSSRSTTLPAAAASASASASVAAAVSKHPSFVFRDSGWYWCRRLKDNLCLVQDTFD